MASCYIRNGQNLSHLLHLRKPASFSLLALLMVFTSPQGKGIFPHIRCQAGSPQILVAKHLDRSSHTTHLTQLCFQMLPLLAPTVIWFIL